MGDVTMQKSFKVSRITGAPRFDSLPVAKITRYPLEERDYMPYAQCILCVGEDSLTLRMWAFEVSPPAASSLRCVLYLYPGRQSDALCVDIYPDGTARVALMRDARLGEDPVVIPSGLYRLKPLAGEDLQGVYWGGTVTIPLDELSELGGPLGVESGNSFPGNFYKLCTREPFVHAGSCFPADFAGNPYSRENMGDFQVVSY